MDPLLTDAVVAAARRGDEAACACIYRALAPAVAGYFRGQGAVDADDLTGDVFVAVVRGLPRFAGDGEALRAWIFTIAHHRLIDARRRRARRPDELASDEILRTLMQPVFGPEREVVERLAAGPAVAALDRLTPDQRATILLRVVADLSVERTAEVLGKRPGAVKTLQRRAIAALRREISRDAVSLSEPRSMTHT
jgi:RNA polymerase sigma-70 factor (ECF subfamily)